MRFPPKSRCDMSLSSSHLAAMNTPPPSDHSRHDDPSAPASPVSLAAEPSDGKPLNDPAPVVSHSVQSGTCCSYCGTTSTSQWRQDPDGGIVCNNCGQSLSRFFSEITRSARIPRVSCVSAPVIPCLIAYPRPLLTLLSEPSSSIRLHFSCTHALSQACTSVSITAHARDVQVLTPPRTNQDNPNCRPLPNRLSLLPQCSTTISNTSPLLLLLPSTMRTPICHPRTTAGQTALPLALALVMADAMELEVPQPAQDAPRTTMHCNPLLLGPTPPPRTRLPSQPLRRP